MWNHIPLTLAQDGKANVTKGGTAPTPTKGGQAKDGAAKDAVPVTKDQPIPTPGQPQNPFGGMFIFILLGMFVLMIFFSMRTQKKERKKRETMLGAIRKGDRIQTIGGILGSVVEVREHKIIIKTDENNNTKTTFARTAIQTIFEDKSETEEADLSKPN